MDAGLKRELEAKVYAGERLTRDDGVALYASDDLAWLGRLAHHKRTGLHGDRVMFIADQQLSLSDVCPADCSGSRWEEWSGAQRLAHAEGTKTTATMGYGHLEEPGHRVDHLLRLRELQDETGGFASFVPLPHQDDPAAGEATDRAVAPAESLKTFAVSRLLFDNVSHVECLWAPHGMLLAQLSLNFGADALDGSVTEDGAAPDAGSDGTPPAMQRDDLLELIGDAGFQPVERDRSYAVVHEYDRPISLAERRSEPQRVWA